MFASAVRVERGNVVDSVVDPTTVMAAKDDQIMSKLQAKVKTQTIDPKTREEQEEERIMERMRKRTKTNMRMQISSVPPPKPSRSQLSVKQQAAVDELDDPVLARLKGVVNKPKGASPTKPKRNNKGGNDKEKGKEPAVAHPNVSVSSSDSDTSDGGESDSDSDESIFTSPKKPVRIAKRLPKTSDSSDEDLSDVMY